MKSRLLWVAVVIGACVGFYFAMVKPALEPSLPSVTIEDLKKMRPPPPLPPPELPLPVIAEPFIAPPAVPPLPLPAIATVQPTAPKPERMIVPIQDGVTIDFSYGAPHIKTQGKDAEELEKALKEMAEATKDLTISSPKPVKP